MPKKKVGIVTLTTYTNYGNRLQNYALLKAVEKMNVDVSTTIINNAQLNSFSSKIKRALSYSIKTNLKNLLTNLKSSENLEVEAERVAIFKDFSKEYLEEISYDINDINDKKRLNNYSFFITGSDQVWNPIEGKKLPIYFLDFTEKNKRLSYAASISVEEIPRNLVMSFTEWLNGMHEISVREEKGSEIIESLTGIKAPVLVDPTMLLTKEEWLSISKRASNRPNTPYLLTYFLGGPTEETRIKLQIIADQQNMTIINLGDIREEDTYKTGPSEFLDYVNNASAFFTDSFHGVVFSILLQTPFVAYERNSSGPSMYSRIETILDNFDMKHREANGFNDDIFSMDFSGTYKILDQEYNKSINYLKEALRIEE